MCTDAERLDWIRNNCVTLERVDVAIALEGRKLPRLRVRLKPSQLPRVRTDAADPFRAAIDSAIRRDASLATAPASVFVDSLERDPPG